jgi:hypothetical protein
MSEWIDVNKRMPHIEYGTSLSVLTYDLESDDYQVLYYDAKDERWTSDDNHVFWPTHWMPLPEPPSSERSHATPEAK